LNGSLRQIKVKTDKTTVKLNRTVLDIVNPELQEKLIRELGAVHVPSKRFVHTKREVIYG